MKKISVLLIPAAILLVLLVASPLVAQDVITKSLVIEPGFNIGVTRKAIGIQFDQETIRTLGPKWNAGKAIPGVVSSPEKLAALGLSNMKAGEKVKVTYIGNDGTNEKFQVEHTGSGRTQEIRVAAEALKQK
jgi:hypothetical protein